MQFQIKNFVGIFENAFSKEYCEAIIQSYELAIEAGFGLSRQQTGTQPKLMQNDTQLFSQENQIPLPEIKNFNDIFWGECYPLYANEFDVIKNSGRHSSYYYKVQKTTPRQGYHVWHCEADSRGTCTRLLAWILYLNDVEEGGETEFLYQAIRIKPKQGTLILWPASFTHTHRGNPPLSNDKYIATGWIEF